MAEEQKTNAKVKLTIPDLPTAIQGDGRYLISLLRQYLKSVNEQVNIANGFTEDETDDPNPGDYIKPKNLTLTFDRLGGVLNWDAITDDKFSYYELRTDTHVGTADGLLERTTATSSLELPKTFAGRIYLYAVSKGGKISNPATLTYSKRRPDAPTDISLTKNNEGTLITFLEIPTDCIGANIYIDGVKYQTLDNVYLYPNKDIKTVVIAYYDQFGEGERAYFNCYVPNVTGFWVEKNDANLYFYWDALSIYNVTYVVKVGNTHDWSQGVEIFRTKINKHRYIRPNKGQSYFMIKAVDDHNNFSDECAWYQIDTSPEINKNIILDFDQEEIGYSCNKVNMFLDSKMGGLKLEKAAFNGEYIMSIQLPQKIKARNWIDEKLNAVTSQPLRIIDCDFAVDSYEATHTLIIGVIGDLDGVELRQQIARYKPAGSGDIFDAIVDGTTAATGGTIAEDRNTSKGDGRYNGGILITDVTQLSYKVSVPEVFSLGFWIKKTKAFTDCIIMTLQGSQTLYVGYDVRLDVYYVRDTKQSKTLTLQLQTMDRDWLYIGIAQSTDARLFFMYGLTYDVKQSVSDTIPPCGAFTSLYCYPKG
jgi:hypothetical protein